MKLLKIQKLRRPQSNGRCLLTTAALCLSTATAQSAKLSVIYPFPASAYSGATGQFTNSSGSSPSAPLLLVGDTLYGTCFSGGTNGYGSIFRVNTNGTGITNLHSFSSANNLNNTNLDGARPYSGLVLLSNTLYGTAYYGGT